MYTLYNISVRNSANLLIYNDIIKAQNATNALYEFIQNTNNIFDDGDTITINEIKGVNNEEYKEKQ